MAITESKTFYPGAYDTSDYVYYQMYEATNPVGKGTSNTTRAYWNLATGNLKTSYVYWPFDCSAIPEGSTIDSVVCKAKVQTTASVTSAGKISTATLQLFAGSSAKGSATSFGQDVTVYTLTPGTWTRDELQTCRLKILCQRGYSNTSQMYAAEFYGADLTVTYTYQSEQFMFKSGGTWNAASKVYKKVSGAWVEVTDLSTAIDTSKILKYGGEIASTANLIGFTIDGTSYQAEEGMTFTQWVASDYNTGGFTIDTSGVYQSSSDQYVCDDRYVLIGPSTVITSGDAYGLTY